MLLRMRTQTHRFAMLLRIRTQTHRFAQLLGIRTSTLMVRSRAWRGVSNHEASMASSFETHRFAMFLWMRCGFGRTGKTPWDRTGRGDAARATVCSRWLRSAKRSRN
jgi:hypothetical protein